MKTIQWKDNKFWYIIDLQMCEADVGETTFNK